MGGTDSDDEVRGFTQPTNTVRKLDRLADTGEWQRLRGICMLKYATSSIKATPDGQCEREGQHEFGRTESRRPCREKRNRQDHRGV